MRSLLRITLILGIIFTSTLVIIRVSGVLSVDDIRYWLTEAQHVSPLYVVAAIFLLLFIDLYIAVPTLAVAVVGGHILGWQWGFAAAAGGMMAAGSLGYVLAARFGDRIVCRIVKDESKREEMREEFEKHGAWMILLSRALPMLPEVGACLAGATGMPYRKFILAWSASAIPYALVAAYSGSVSSLDDPMPAIYGVIGLSAILGGSWYLFLRFTRSRVSTGTSEQQGRVA